MSEQVSEITLCEVTCSTMVIPKDYLPDSTKKMVWLNCSCEDDGSFKRLRKIPNIKIINQASSKGSLSGCTGVSSMEA
jgi:hypothetical protein